MADATANPDKIRTIAEISVMVVGAVIIFALIAVPFILNEYILLIWPCFGFVAYARWVDDMTRYRRRRANNDACECEQASSEAA